MAKVDLAIFASIIGIAAVFCLRLVPERANVTKISDKYMYSGKFYITRFGRKSPYFINIQGKAKYSWENNVTVHIIFSEYLHNEYRRSFVEIHMLFCDFVHKDPWIGRMLKRYGVVCPAPAGEYNLLNMTIPMEDFHYQIPFYKFRIDIEVSLTDTRELIVQSYFQGVFKPK